MYDVLIIGGGVVGASAAYMLSRYHVSVLVLEKENDVACGTTKANSAILHAGYDPEPGTLMARLNVRGSALSKELCENLSVGYRQTGSLVVALSEGEIPAVKTLYERGVKNGVKGLRILSGAEAKSMEPGLADGVCAALYAPTAAIVRPWEFCLALMETAVRNGVTLFCDSEVTAIEKQPDGTFRITAGERDFAARTVINAAGVHSDRVHNLAAPEAFHILPSKGEYFLLDKCEGARVSHVVFQCPNENGKGVLVAPTTDGNLIIGPNASQVTDGEDVSVTAQGLAFVRASAVRAVPGVGFQNSIRSFAGVRAVSDRNDFIIGETATVGFYDAAAIKSPGLTSAPAIGEYLVELLSNRLVLKEKKNFNGTRKVVHFRELSEEQRVAVVRANPAFGRVICRCETVTEGEILDALKSPVPPVSVDGVKRRCGAGMGRCQGGFCGPRVLDIIAKERGVPPKDVMQDLAGSYLLCGETKRGGECE